jgi:phage portal protein BeeE
LGLLGFLKGPGEAQAPGLVERSEPTDKIDAILASIIEKRRSGFTIEQARSIPAINRALSLIASHAASFLPLAYRNGQAMPSQPRIVRNPMAFGSRYELVEQTVLSLAEHGCAPWHIRGRVADADDPSRSVIVLPHEEMTVEWAVKPWTRIFRWNGRTVGEQELIHIDIGRRSGELHGRGPLSDSLDMLYPVWEAEQFAANFFTSGGVPEVVLKTAAQLSGDEAQELKRRWIETADSMVRVASGGVEPVFPGIDPQRAQLQEARSFGATVAATIFGIPAALLHVQTSGATITYTNPAGAVEEMVKATIAPRYLVPIETAWSQLVASTQTVRFDLADMQRTDIKARFDLYKQAIETTDAEGVPLMTSREARSFEGWGTPGTPDEAAPQFAPVETAPEPSTSAAEVPS